MSTAPHQYRNMLFNAFSSFPNLKLFILDSVAGKDICDAEFKGKRGRRLSVTGVWVRQCACRDGLALYQPTIQRSDIKVSLPSLDGLID